MSYRVGPEVTMFQGLRSAIYGVRDLPSAKTWYTALVGKEPYFDEPFYVGFDVGGYELGLHPVTDEAGLGCWTYWGVPDADAAFAVLLAAGAVPLEPVRDVGGGIRLGTVTDADGNRLGVIFNPHFAVR